MLVRGQYAEVLLQFVAGVVENSDSGGNVVKKMSENVPFICQLSIHWPDDKNRTMQK